MSQVVNAPAVQPQRCSAVEKDGFDYRPVPPHAVVAAVLGALSATALLGITGIAVAVFGTIVSAFSVWRIRAAGGALGGRVPATAGLVLSLLFLIGGTSYQTYLYQTEVPEGYQRVSFSTDISRKGFVNTGGALGLHPDVEPLIGQDVFLKGFMYPTGQMQGLDSFLLVKDSGTCCFGGQPATEDMIGVVMEGDRTVDYYQGRVSVAGTLELNPNQAAYAGNQPVYLLRGRIVTKSRSAL